MTRLTRKMRQTLWEDIGMNLTYRARSGSTNISRDQRSSLSTHSSPLWATRNSLDNWSLTVPNDLTLLVTILSRYARDLRTDFGPSQSWELQSHYWTLHSRSQPCFSSVRFSVDIFNCGRGDIRIVKAVECDDLLHLVFAPLTRFDLLHDVVVLPANGDRDLAR